VLFVVPLMPSVGLDPIVGVALGTLAGGLGQIAMQWPSAHRLGYRFRFRLAFRDAGLREIVALMAPGTMGLAAVQINLFVTTILATGEGSGAISWLNYAFRIMYLPIGLFGVSIAAAAVPTLSAQAAMEDRSAMRETLSKSLRMMLMLNVPATLGLIALATPIVALIFERGAFVASDTAAVAAALMCYAPGLIGYSAVKVASPTFYALKDSRTPVAVSVASVMLNLALSLALVRVLGYLGLALATATAALANALLLLVLLSKRLDGLDTRRVMVALVKITTAGFVMAFAARLAHELVAEAWPGRTLVPQLVRVGIAVATGLATLAASAQLLRIEEFGQALGRLTRKLGRA
jgi:putative peptidoglycan lipid II flippase